METEPSSCSIHAPAKLNLHLSVGAARPDGFHNIESIFAALSFGDDLYFSLSGEDGKFDLTLKKVPGTIFLGEDNLITRAVRLFREKTGFGRGIRCVLDKRIPLGAGLGGGSSDAASTLMALNFLAKTGLSSDELCEMAARLGSDVPFFLNAGVAWVTGRGEKIKALPALPDFSVLLVMPPIHSSTAEAFRLLDEEKKALLSGSSHTENSVKTDCRGVNENTAGQILTEMSPKKWPFSNDFLPVLPDTKIYQGIIQNLVNNGALFAGLSGSGSCCFGVFGEEKFAVGVKNKIKSEIVIKNKENPQNFIECTFFLASAAIPVLE